MNLTLLAIFSASFLFSQTDGIIGFAQREMTSPEGIDVIVVVSGKPTTTLDEALRIVAELGISVQELSGLGDNVRYAMGEQEVRTNFSFQTVVPYARLRETRDRIAAVQKNLPAGIELDCGLGIRASDRAVEAMRQELWPELAAEARRKAESFATATNVRLGAIRGVTETEPAFLRPVANFGFSLDRLRYRFFLSILYAVAP